jgi:hypothetical protein
MDHGRTPFQAISLQSIDDSSVVLEVVLCPSEFFVEVVDLHGEGYLIAHKSIKFT